MQAPGPHHRPDQGRALDPGRYYGAIDGRFETAHAVLSQVVHASARSLPEHDHALAYFCMLVDGDYVETAAGREFDYQLFEVGFHPARTPHRDAIRGHGARFLCLEIRPEPLAAADLRLRTVPELLPAVASLQLLRLYRAFAARTLSPIVVESAVWELCCAVSGVAPVRERRVPAWLRRCFELIEAEYARTLTVTEIAALVGVHPVHLSREFRRRFGQTLGEYVHKARVRAACALMSRDEVPLAIVAASVGFADQAHFCRVFKGLVGCTPSTFLATCTTRH